MTRTTNMTVTRRAGREGGREEMEMEVDQKCISDGQTAGAEVPER